MRVGKVVMRYVTNFVWKVTGGIVFAIIWLVIAVVLALSIVGAKYASGAVRIAYFAWKPYGKNIDILEPNHMIMSIIYLLTIGTVLSFLALLVMLAELFSIVGIPLIYQCYKVLKVSLFPFNTRIM